VSEIDGLKPAAKANVPIIISSLLICYQ